MNAPFPPAGPDSSGDEPELRSLLAAEARNQPPVSDDLRAGVDRRVRRHRVRVAAVVAPAVALVLVGGVLLAPRSSTEATLDTAAEPTAEQVDGTAPSTDTTVPADESTVPADTTDETPAPVPADPTGGDCGTVEIGPDRVDPETGPINCFIDAFNAGTDARLVVLVSGPDGGQLTETVTTAPGKTVDVAVAGSLSVKVPDLGNFGGGGGGLVAPESGGTATDCGTITVTEGAPADQLTPSSETMRCLIGLFTSGGTGGFTMVANDATGGTMTTRVDLGSDHLLTVTIDGHLTQALPAELVIPSDLTDHLPPNGFGLDELGLGGHGGALLPGAQPGS